MEINNYLGVRYRFKNMSKIGKKPIDIPNNVKVEINGNLILVKGSGEELKRELPNFLKAEVKDNKLFISIDQKLKNSSKKEKEYLKLWGLNSALVKNLIIGSNEPFKKNLEFEGVGYKAALKGSDLELNLGFSHPITIKGPKGITFKVEKNIISIMGIDKELVGHVAAEIRSKRKPEPYRGSGIKYQGEYIKRKAGKKAATSA